MDYHCTDLFSDDTSQRTWDASLEVISRKGPFFELRMVGRGSSIHAIVGPQVNGSFICIPNYDAGSELAGLEDTFWNTERLAPLIGVVDAVTVAQGLRQLSLKLKEETG
jgi:hypothetical protein